MCTFFLTSTLIIDDPRLISGWLPSRGRIGWQWAPGWAPVLLRDHVLL